MIYPWHQNTYKQITDSFLQGRGHHALLIKTDTGIGSEELICDIIDWLLCREPNGTQACHQCKSCELVKSGNHPDLHILQSADGKDIGVDDVRQINTRLQNYAQQGGNSVVYIKGLDYLNQASSNALLKTLEEPREGVYFILDAPLNAAIAATIQSRCQIHTLKAPPESEVLEWLQAEFPQTPAEDLKIVTDICKARPLICKNFIKNDRLSQRKNLLKAFWRFTLNHDITAFVKVFDGDKAQLLEQLDWLESFYVDAMKAKVNILNDWKNTDMKKAITLFSEKMNVVGLMQSCKAINETRTYLTEINTMNQELILLNFATQLLTMTDHTTIHQMLSDYLAENDHFFSHPI